MTIEEVMNISAALMSTDNDKAQEEEEEVAGGAYQVIPYIELT